MSIIDIIQFWWSYAHPKLPILVSMGPVEFNIWDGPGCVGIFLEIFLIEKPVRKSRETERKKVSCRAVPCLRRSSPSLGSDDLRITRCCDCVRISLTKFRALPSPFSCSFSFSLYVTSMQNSHELHLELNFTSLLFVLKRPFVSI